MEHNQNYVFSAFRDASGDAEGEELAFSLDPESYGSELMGLPFSEEVHQWIDQTLDPEEGWVLVTPADGDFRKNDSGERIEVRVQDGTVVLVQHLMP